NIDGSTFNVISIEASHSGDINVDLVGNISLNQIYISSSYDAYVELNLDQVTLQGNIELYSYLIGPSAAVLVDATSLSGSFDHILLSAEDGGGLDFNADEYSITLNDLHLYASGARFDSSISYINFTGNAGGSTFQNFNLEAYDGGNINLNLLGDLSLGGSLILKADGSWSLEHSAIVFNAGIDGSSLDNLHIEAVNGGNVTAHLSGDITVHEGIFVSVDDATYSITSGNILMDHAALTLSANEGVNISSTTDGFLDGIHGTFTDLTLSADFMSTICLDSPDLGGINTITGNVLISVNHSSDISLTANIDGSLLNNMSIEAGYGNVNLELDGNISLNNVYIKTDTLGNALLNFDDLTLYGNIEQYASISTDNTNDVAYSLLGGNSINGTFDHVFLSAENGGASGFLFETININVEDVHLYASGTRYTAGVAYAAFYGNHIHGSTIQNLTLEAYDGGYVNASGDKLNHLAAESFSLTDSISLFANGQNEDLHGVEDSTINLNANIDGSTFNVISIEASHSGDINVDLVGNISLNQ
ncbi:hypothetical protein EB001_24575, partial [bacterium]|nr:hypothetical protein [bacterium]